MKVREATGSGREPCRTCLASLTHPSLVLHRQRGTWGRACARAPSPGPHAYADDQACTPAPRALRIPMASPLPPPSKGSGGPNLQSWGLSTASHAYTDGQPSAPHLYHRGPWGSKPPVPGAVTPGPASEPPPPSLCRLPKLQPGLVSLISVSLAEEPPGVLFMTMFCFRCPEEKGKRIFFSQFKGSRCLK